MKSQMKYIPAVLVGLAMILPVTSYAATLEETRHTIILQLIQLIQQEIAYLQGQLALQEGSGTPLGGSNLPVEATSTSNMTKITTLTQTLMEEQIVFDAFIGSVQQNEDGTFILFEANKPVNTAEITFTNGVHLVRIVETATNSVYKRTGKTSYQYRLELSGVENHVPFSMTIVDTDGSSLTKTASL